MMKTWTLFLEDFSLVILIVTVTFSQCMNFWWETTPLNTLVKYIA